MCLPEREHDRRACLEAVLFDLRDHGTGNAGVLGRFLEGEVEIEGGSFHGLEAHQSDSMEVGSEAGVQGLGSNRIVFVDEAPFVVAKRLLQKWNLLPRLDRSVGIGLVLDFEIRQLSIEIVTDPNFMTRSAATVVFAQAIIVPGVEVERLVLGSRRSFGCQERVDAFNLAQYLMQRVSVQNELRVHALEQRPFLQKCRGGLRELA